MPLLIGALLAAAAAVFAALSGFDRSRAVYPLSLIVIATYYPLFAILGGAGEALPAELVLVTAFTLVAVWGFRRNLWLVVLALAAHGVMDAVHPHLVSNPGVPSWWPQFCLAYDLVAAGGLAVLIWRGLPASDAQRGASPTP